MHLFAHSFSPPLCLSVCVQCPNVCVHVRVCVCLVTVSGTPLLHTNLFFFSQQN